MGALFDICLPVSPYRAVARELRLLLSPLDSLHHRLLSSVEAYYCLERDELILRLRFSTLVTEPSHKERLIAHLSRPGLEILVPEKMQAMDRALFEKRLRDESDISLQQFPSKHQRRVMDNIFSGLDAHIEELELLELERQRSLSLRKATDVAPETPAIESTREIGHRPLRHQTVDAIEALDSFIQELSPPPALNARAAPAARPGTIDALDAIIEELPYRSPNPDALDNLLEMIEGTSLP